MKQHLLHIGMALVALSAGCTCELKFGPGVSDTTPVLPVTHTAAAVEPEPQPAAAAAVVVTEPAAPEPTGVLAEASARKTAARHHNELLFCMKQEETAQPPSLRVQFVVKPDGSVGNKVDVLERSEMSDKLASCMVSAVKRWKFERPKGGAARATLLLKR